MEFLKAIRYNLIQNAKIMLYGFSKIFIRIEMRWYALKRCIGPVRIAAAVTLIFLKGDNMTIPENKSIRAQETARRYI